MAGNGCVQERPTPRTSGKLTRETWETIRDMIVDAAKKRRKLDGVVCRRHGAMVEPQTEDERRG